MKYAMTIWFTAVAVAGIIYAARTGPVSTGYFDAAMVLIALLAFRRDTWRARYEHLAEDPGPDLAPPRRDLPSSIRVLRPGATGDETRDIPAVRPDNDGGWYRRY